MRLFPVPGAALRRAQQAHDINKVLHIVPVLVMALLGQYKGPAGVIIAGLAIKLLQRGFHDPAGGSLTRRVKIEDAIRVKAFKQPQLALARDLAGKQLRHADGPLGIIHPEAERVCREDRFDAGLGGQKGNLKPHAGQNTQLLSRQIQKP